MNTTDYIYGLLNLKVRNLIFSTLVFIFLSAKQIKLNIYKSSHHRWNHRRSRKKMEFLRLQFGRSLDNGIPAFWLA